MPQLQTLTKFQAKLYLEMVKHFGEGFNTFDGGNGYKYKKDDVLSFLARVYPELIDPNDPDVLKRAEEILTATVKTTEEVNGPTVPQDIAERVKQMEKEKAAWAEKRQSHLPESYLRSIRKAIQAQALSQEKAGEIEDIVIQNIEAQPEQLENLLAQVTDADMAQEIVQRTLSTLKEENLPEEGKKEATSFRRPISQEVSSTKREVLIKTGGEQESRHYNPITGEIEGIELQSEEGRRKRDALEKIKARATGEASFLQAPIEKTGRVMGRFLQRGFRGVGEGYDRGSATQEDKETEKNPVRRLMGKWFRRKPVVSIEEEGKVGKDEISKESELRQIYLKRQEEAAQEPEQKNFATEIKREILKQLGRQKQVIKEGPGRVSRGAEELGIKGKLWEYWQRAKGQINFRGIWDSTRSFFSNFGGPTIRSFGRWLGSEGVPAISRGLGAVLRGLLGGAARAGGGLAGSAISGGVATISSGAVAAASVGVGVSASTIIVAILVTLLVLFVMTLITVLGVTGGAFYTPQSGVVADLPYSPPTVEVVKTASATTLTNAQVAAGNHKLTYTISLKNNETISSQTVTDTAIITSAGGAVQKIEIPVSGNKAEFVVPAGVHDAVIINSVTVKGTLASGKTFGPITAAATTIVGSAPAAAFSCPILNPGRRISLHSKDWNGKPGGHCGEGYAVMEVCYGANPWPGNDKAIDIIGSGLPGETIVMPAVNGKNVNWTKTDDGSDTLYSYNGVTQKYKEYKTVNRGSDGKEHTITAQFHHLIGGEGVPESLDSGATVGATAGFDGNKSSPHLHLQMAVDGVWVPAETLVDCEPKI